MQLKSFIILLTLILFASCANSVRYERAQSEAYLIDYGYHSSLVLRNSEGTLWEFAYGDWQWFALDKTGWWRLPKTLFWPTDAAIGRRKYERDENFERHLGRFKNEKFIFQVSPKKAQELIDSLNRYFSGATPSEVYFQERYNLEFVLLSEQNYHAFYNCNHVISQWMEKLGMEVSGTRIFSHWKFELKD